MTLNKTLGGKQKVLINILTRTANRPSGFDTCRQSIVSQLYRNMKHFVSYENEIDLGYIDYEGVDKVKVKRFVGSLLVNPEGYLHAPYNLYCNELLNKVENGWILFLDDDVNLLHNKVIQEIVTEIHKADEDTMFIWKMRYPNGKVLPLKKHFNEEKIEINNIDTSCFIFHSKYKDFAKWDPWKASDYRVIKALHETIPHTKWIEKVYIQINNYGDYGKRNDIGPIVTNNLIFNKKWYWLLIPKYHTQINSIHIFQQRTYIEFWKSVITKIKRIFQKIKTICLP